MVKRGFHVCFLFGLVVAALVPIGCRQGSSTPQGAGSSTRITIMQGGSDTMVNLAQMWAEQYQHVAPDVSIEVSGGGTGVGIRDLTQGIIHLANCSRELEPHEREQVRKNTGKEPIETVVGFDGIAIYVHGKNPIEELTMEQLAEIFGEGGKIERWSQLGIDMSKIGAADNIVRVSRQNSSGTYLYFRDHVLSRKDFKPGSLDMSGSKDVVELVSRTKSAIGYSGMGYATAGVKLVKIKLSAAAEAVAPTVENVLSRKYPLARSLLIYTLGEPQGAVKDYLNWILSPAGQKIVERAGYVPVTSAPLP